MSADLVDLEALRSDQASLITEKAREYVAIVKVARVAALAMPQPK